MRLTLIGMYNYDTNLFDGMQLPEGADLQTFIDTLLLEYGECPVLYANVDFMKSAIEKWAAAYSDNFNRIFSVMSADYNPIHNFDRNEDYEDHYSSNSNGSDTGTNSTTSGTSSSGSSENTVSAYNVSTYQPDSKTEDSAAVTGTSSGQSTVNRTNAEQNDNVHHGHLYGNIGVTRTQEMINDEILLRSDKNPYMIAATMFRERFLLYLY